MDVSHNSIAELENMEYCYCLEVLDLGFNSITTVKETATFLGSVRVLILRNNAITSLAGLEVRLSVSRSQPLLTL